MNDAKSQETLKIILSMHSLMCLREREREGKGGGGGGGVHSPYLILFCTHRSELAWMP